MSPVSLRDQPQAPLAAPSAPPPPPMLRPPRAKLFARAWRILATAARFGFGWWLDDRAWSYAPGETRAERDVKRARWLRDELISLGPTFVKVGQTLSTRVDLLPVTYVDEMALLQDRIPPFDSALARSFVEAELGAPIEAVFSAFPDAPIAAASLGQVYHARLRNGDEVAVKVQRPDLLERFAIDLTVLRGLASFVERRTRWLPGVELVDIVDEFGRKLHEEVDYLREADNAERFSANFTEFDRLAVPRIYRAHSTRRVLTMSFMHGVKVTNIAELQRMRVDVPAVVRYAAHVNLKQLLEDGFFHADLHPGNILVQADGTLVFIDFGLMGEITRPMRAQMVEAFLHVVDGDVEGLIQDLVLLGFLRPGQDPSPLRPPLQWVMTAFMQPFDKRPTFKELTDPVADVFFRYHLRVPVYFSWVIRTMISLEGIAMQLDPTFHPFDVAIPYAAKLILSEQGQDIRDRLVEEILTPAGIDWDRLFELVKLAQRDPGFQMGEVATLGVDWLLSREGRYVLDRALGDLLGEGAVPWDRLEALIQLAQTDPTFDLMKASRPMVAFLLTPEAGPVRQRLVWKLGKDMLTGRIGEWTGLYKVARVILATVLPGR